MGNNTVLQFKTLNYAKLLKKVLTLLHEHYMMKHTKSVNTTAFSLKIAVLYNYVLLIA